MTSKIFVGHLSEQTTEEALRTVFEQFGEVKQLDLRTGFAFVLFGSEEEAQRAIEAMHDKELDGNRIRVEKERGSGEGSFRADRVKPPRRLDLRLVVRGLHPKVDWKDLKDWARETVGEVTYSNVFDRDGQHMGLIELKVGRPRRFVCLPCAGGCVGRADLVVAPRLDDWRHARVCDCANALCGCVAVRRTRRVWSAR